MKFRASERTSSESVGKGAALEEFVASYHHHMIADTYQQKDDDMKFKFLFI